MTNLIVATVAAAEAVASLSPEVRQQLLAILLENADNWPPGFLLIPPEELHEGTCPLCRGPFAVKVLKP